MKISIVIPNYNGAELLKRNLPSVFAAASFYVNQTKQPIEIIVIDDASEDNSLDVLENYKNKSSNTISFIYEQKKRNEGFSPTVNIGVKKTSGDIIILLNTDVSPQENFLSPLLSHFSDEKVFAVGMMDKSIENNREILRGRGIGTWDRGFLIHAAGNMDKSNSLWVSGGSSAFRKKIWEELGGLDELFAPFYWEDIDIGYRALKSGYKIFFEKHSIGIHEHEKGAILTKYSKDDIQKIAFRNQFIFVWKNADDMMIWYHIVWLPYHILKAIMRKDRNFLSGFWDALHLLPRIREKRKIVQKQFIYSDYAIIGHYKE